jgi:hypothetical protein
MPRPYDDSQRATADFIQRNNPLWVVIWGTGSRRYWAFPAFDVPPGLILQSADPDKLVTQMRQTELRHLPPPYHPPAPPPQTR